jgi:hypothetical protein
VKVGITYASPGAGTPLHLAGELFSKAAGVEMLHVPYKGSAPALNDLIAGRVDVMFDVFGSSMQFVNTGKLRALAATSMQKSAQLPNMPTLNDQRLRGFDVTSGSAFRPSQYAGSGNCKIECRTQQGSRLARNAGASRANWYGTCRRDARTAAHLRTVGAGEMGQGDQGRQATAELGICKGWAAGPAWIKRRRPPAGW